MGTPEAETVPAGRVRFEPNFFERFGRYFTGGRHGGRPRQDRAGGEALRHPGSSDRQLRFRRPHGAAAQESAAGRTPVSGGQVPSGNPAGVSPLRRCDTGTRVPLVSGFASARGTVVTHGGQGDRIGVERRHPQPRLPYRNEYRDRGNSFVARGAARGETGAVLRSPGLRPHPVVRREDGGDFIERQPAADRPAGLSLGDGKSGL